MDITGWVLTKFDSGDDMNPLLPLVASMSIEWHGTMMPDTADGWALVWVRCDVVHLALIRQDPDMVWIGNEWDVIPAQVLSTYADKLDPAVTYANMGQVLSKLGEWESRFLE
jgi:hypothetical protein